MIRHLLLITLFSFPVSASAFFFGDSRRGYEINPDPIDQGTLPYSVGDQVTLTGDILSLIHI